MQRQCLEWTFQLKLNAALRCEPARRSFPISDFYPALGVLKAARPPCSLVQIPYLSWFVVRKGITFVIFLSCKPVQPALPEMMESQEPIVFCLKNTCFISSRACSVSLCIFALTSSMRKSCQFRPIAGFCNAGHAFAGCGLCAAQVCGSSNLD